jgi:ketosteroid isomerase-like protein
MSKENVELAREVLDAVGRRDVPRLIGLAQPDVEWHSFFALGQEGGMYRGHDGTEQYMRDLGDALESAVVELDDAMGVGDIAVLVGRIRTRGRGSGAESNTPAGWMLKFREGKLVRFRAFRKPDDALEAVGLSE